MEKETMLGRIILALIKVPTEMLGTVFDLLNRLAGEKGQETYKNLKHLLRGEFEIKSPPLIQWIDTIETLSTTKKFIAKDNFCMDSKEVKFNLISKNFINWFLHLDGKVENYIGKQKIRVGSLLKTQKLNHELIIKELGGEEQAETTLMELYDLLKIQPNGEEGILLNNGYYNVFYIRSISSALRVVRVYWYGNSGWSVNASHADSINSVWPATRRVFSRNS